MKYIVLILLSSPLYVYAQFKSDIRFDAGLSSEQLDGSLGYQLGLDYMFSNKSSIGGKVLNAGSFNSFINYKYYFINTSIHFYGMAAYHIRDKDRQGFGIGTGLLFPISDKFKIGTEAIYETTFSIYYINLSAVFIL